MNKTKILVVDDEEDIIDLIRYNLEQEEFIVFTASDGEECLRQVKTQSPDLIILDVMMPGLDGLEVCRKLRKSPATRSIPVIMLTAKAEEADVIHGLETGADDYVLKPFSPKVLLARVKSILRRTAEDGENCDIISEAGLLLNMTERTLTFKGRDIQLTYLEFEILKVLISSPGKVYSRSQIMKEAREDYISTERAIDVQILNLRRKLGTAAEYIKTVRGAGYKFAL